MAGPRWVSHPSRKDDAKCRTADWGKEVRGRRFATPHQHRLASGGPLAFKKRVGIGTMLFDQLVVNSEKKKRGSPLPYEQCLVLPSTEMQPQRHAHGR